MYVVQTVETVKVVKRVEIVEKIATADESRMVDIDENMILMSEIMFVLQCYPLDLPYQLDDERVNFSFETEAYLFHAWLILEYWCPLPSV